MNVIKTVLMQGEEAALECFLEICEIRDSLISQTVKALLYRKIVLWMDLDVLDTGYVKGEILEAVQGLISYKNKHGYLPVKTEYVHPKRSSELPPINETQTKQSLNLMSIIETFSEEFESIVSLIENNFKLKTVRSI